MSTMYTTHFRIFVTAFIAVFISVFTFGQKESLGFNSLLAHSPNAAVAFCIPNNALSLETLRNDGIPVKCTTKKWIYVTVTPQWVDEHIKNGSLNSYYYEFAPPVALADTARLMHYVNPVHAGGPGLGGAYTGENVIIGFVDQGLDFNHPDFIDANGNTRVLRYWDHTLNAGGTVPQPYNYGVVWTEQDITNGSCTSNEIGTAHGTSVAGIGAGNGTANGSNKGMAPNSKIIVVETDFNLPNWTLTIADACDYIFKVADSLGLPAVVNLSLGTYLGSHDGNDPASEMMEQLLDEHSGRIIVCAAGNAGNKGKYHVRGAVDADTSFVWFSNNASTQAAFGPNTIFFDLWSDTTEASYQFAYGANLPSGSYSSRGQSNFRTAMANLDVSLFDTIYNFNGNRIATIETYTEKIDGSFHLQALFTHVDTTTYHYRFITTGSGSYDLWSGAWLGLNNIVNTLPSAGVYPPILHYHAPDSLQTIVSSWNCSEKVISVGNVRCRLGHIDNNGNQYYPASDMTHPGKLSPNSSKGPSRHDLIKPDVSASGDVTLGSGPLSFLMNPANNAAIDSGGWHVRNGGTSMASPTVAGIAALYLEKCGHSTWADFKEALIATSFTDFYTGSVPNNAYGHGKPHALNLLLQANFTPTLSGTPSFCPNGSTDIQVNSPNGISEIQWSDGTLANPNSVSSEGPISAIVYNASGCKATTATLNIVQLDTLPMLPIFQSGNVLATLSFSTYQWTLNGQDIPGATSQTLEIFPPYGVYTCYCVSPDGCITETAPFSFGAGVASTSQEHVSIFPNPSDGMFTIFGFKTIDHIELIDQQGKCVALKEISEGNYSIEHLEKGIYMLFITSNERMFQSKIIRM
jgi:hypothetical protein